MQNEPDDYLNQQDALAISLDGWPLGSPGEWNDLDQSNLLFSIVEYNAAPVFVSGSSFTVQENQSFVGQAQASDPNGDTISYLISGGADQSLFSINTITGELSFFQAPDFEDPTDAGNDNEYNLRVEASDGSLSAAQDITITITDIVESTPNNPPTGLDSAGTLVMQENEPVGTIVGAFLAQDPDGDALSYHLVSGLGDGNNSLFVIDLNGTLRTGVEFDYESYQSLSIRVAAMDEYNASTEGEFIVIVTDINEDVPNQAPHSLDSGGTLLIRENEPAGTVVGVFQAQDPDGDALSYHLVSGLGDGNNSLFVMDLNGTLRTGVEFDYESYQSLSIRVAAMDEDNASVEGEFIVIVTDINEDVPNQAPHSLDSGGTLLYRRENEPAGTVVGVFQAQDPDGDALSYHLVSGLGDGNNSLFVMDLNGTLKTGVEFDYESYQSLSIRVAAMDEDNASTEGEFLVNVTDVNETLPNLAPVGLDHVGSLSIAENEPAGTVVGVFQAQDPDGDALSYHLISGLGDGNNSLFVMDLNGTLRTGVEFDYESYQSLSIRVAAMDEHNASTEGEFLVNVTDVNETVGVIVFMVSGGGWNYPFYQFEDADGQAVDFSSYIMMPGETYEFKADGVSVTHPFMIGEIIGDINSPLVTGGPLTSNAGTITLEIPSDHQGDFYYFCTDHVSMAAPFQIATVNQAPIGLYNLGALSIAENEPAGTVVGVFQSQDPDGDALSYHLVSGLGDGNNSLFVMDVNGTLRTEVSFDYESYQSLSIRVAAMDEHNASTEGEFLVSVTDVNETLPNQTPLGLYYVGVLSIAENEPVGTFVGTFLAQDPDGDQLTYNLASGLGDGNNSLFVMDANGTLRTEVPFDYESYKSLSIRVAATDEHNASVEDMFTVVVLDVSEPNQPPENLYSIADLKVMENLPVGTVVGDFNATDPEGGELVFMLTGGAGAINNSMFTMDVNGTLRTAEIFDHESNEFLSIRVAVLDEFFEMTSESFVVQVQDDVDETVGSPPIDLNTTMPLEIYENQPAGTLVGTFEAEDPEGGSLFYFLMNTDDFLDNPKFSLESNGTLFSAEEFDYESTSRLQIRVGVLDSDNLVSSAIFEVMVVDVNDSINNLPPVDLYSIQPLSIQENMSPGTFIGEFNATDPEGGQLFYFLTQEMAMSTILCFHLNPMESLSQQVPMIMKVTIL